MNRRLLPVWFYGLSDIFLIVSIILCHSPCWADGNEVTVAWVLYDNRADFELDKMKMQLFFKGATEEAKNYISVNIKAPLRGQDSFEEALEQALIQLKGVDNPILNIAISSHGSISTLSRQYGPNISYQDLVDLVLKKE